MSRGFRAERDYLGKKEVPEEAYWGVQTQRAIENFNISGINAHPEFIKNAALVKRAVAEANMAIGRLPKKIGQAIVKATTEVMKGKLLDHFPLDVFQAGAGTSFNLNVCEVIANRAIEMLGGKKGDYRIVHPNDHVNMAQSTNDFFPTVMRMTALSLVQGLLSALSALEASLLKKAKEFDDVVKPGRTHLTDAPPIRMGQVFGAYATMVQKDAERIAATSERLLELNIGATAVGTGLNAGPLYIDTVVRRLREITGLKLRRAKDLVERAQSVADFVDLSGALRVLAVDLTKVSNDLRLMASGPVTGFGEIEPPAVQPGSSMMPGKVNPVIAECLNMICFEVMGNDSTIALAGQAGQLELNVMMPIIAHDLIQSLVILTNGVRMFDERLVKGLMVNRERCRLLSEASPGVAVALTPYLGFEATAKIAQEAVRRGKGVKEVALEKGLLPRAQLDAILDPYSLTKMSMAARKERRVRSNTH